MKRFLKIVLICIPALGFGNGNKGPVIQADFSETNITPEKHIVMSGYGGRDDPYESIHDSIYAKADVQPDYENTLVELIQELLSSK